MGSEYHWGFSPYLERRNTLLGDCPQMVADQRFIHLGLYVIVGLGTALHAPLDAIGKIKDDFRGLDILVNNAGIMIDTQSGILELDPAAFHNTLTTNVFGPLLLAQACIPLMKASGYGRIVNMASTLDSLNDISNPDGLYGAVLSPAYRLSKTLLNGITVFLANALRGTNILVNSACPGWVRTDMGGSQAPPTPEQGADTPVWLATLPDGGPHGGFFRERQPIPW